MVPRAGSFEAAFQHGVKESAGKGAAFGAR